MIPDEEDGDAAVDPTSDLFFTLVALILPAILLLLPMVGVAADAHPSPSREAARALLAAELTLDGSTPLTVLATEAGLTLEEDGREIPLDALFEDATLLEALSAAEASSQAVLLLVAAGGEEASFLFDSLAAEAGLDTIAQVRLDDSCGFAFSARLAALCKDNPR